ncbi:hypothetical protein ACFSFZ_06365 [Mixta tenebrionis]|uniref:hypothetical protein n=1 Tax=Mixta tenebrionis TaxID=2562439 RepID=UPI0015E867E8|nr:hypothetical protein [Mixta tenebrionis]
MLLRNHLKKLVKPPKSRTSFCSENSTGFLGVATPKMVINKKTGFVPKEEAGFGV